MVVERVYAVDEVLLKLSYVAETVFWAATGTCKMKNPKMKIEIQSLNNKNRVDVCATYI